MACTYCASMLAILVLMPPSLGPFSVLIRLILLSASCTLQTCSQPAPPWAPPCPKSPLLPQGPRALRQGFARTPISETRSASCQMLQPATLMCDALGLEMPGLRRDAQTSRGNAPPSTRGGEGGRGGGTTRCPGTALDAPVGRWLPTLTSRRESRSCPR